MWDQGKLLQDYKQNLQTVKTKDTQTKKHIYAVTSSTQGK